MRHPSLLPGLLATTLVTLAALTPGQATLAAEPAAAPDAAAALYDRAWQQDLEQSPLGATYIGDTRYNDRWPDLSPAAFNGSAAADQATLDAALALPRAGLAPGATLNLDLFIRDYRQRMAQRRFRLECYDLSAGGGVQSLNEVAEVQPLETVADYDTWLRRLAGIPAYLAQYEALLDGCAKQGRTQPRVLMDRVVPQLAAQVVRQPEDSPFWAPFKALPAGLPAADQARLQAEARRVIGTAVLPAYARFDRFFRERYLPRTRTSVGLWDTPDGTAAYADRITYHTTTTMSAEEIHAVGLAEVARIRGEMAKVMAEVGFQGTLEEFFQHLRTDPQFYYKTPDELFRAYVVAAKLIEPELPKLFGKLYRTPFGLRPIPDTSAPTTTTAYYSGPSADGRRAGYYYVNLYRPEVRPKYEIEVLTVHESVPGHHLQIALAQEQGDQPLFRRFSGYTAYVEGWALYSERLGYDLGLYKDPYSRFGQLTYDMWRAVRLVVDTGLHAKRWSRQQAIDYFKANAAKTEADIVNEIDRYIGHPGQALAYKVGQLRILALRAEAERELGDRFDIRGFHDAVLATGAVPLDVLNDAVHGWIAARRAAPTQQQ